jgi:hypothetical protein
VVSNCTKRKTIMSRLIETTEALTIIRKALEELGPTAPTNDTELLLDRNRVSQMASVFQPRNRDGYFYADKGHIASLAEAIGKNPENPNYLDRITVWWGGDRWYVIDGHHRLDAYRERGVHKAIPAKVFSGSLDEAMAHSGAANSRDKLPMSKDDKLAFAWRLTLTTGLSKSRISRACAISVGTIHNMRAVRDKLMADTENTVEDLLSEGWKQSNMRARGIESYRSHPDPDNAVRERADVYRERLYKVLGNKPHTDPEAFAMALLLSDARLPAKLMESGAWSSAFFDLVEARKDELDADRLVAALSDY